MRIGIDARFYGSLGKGLGRYVSELISGLERLDTENEYVVFLREENFSAYEPKSPRFRKVVAEFHWYGWREQLLYPFWLRKFQLDLMHFPHFNVPFLYRGPFVVTIHDLILLSHPTMRATTLAPLLYRIKYLGYRMVISRAMRAARKVITVSDTVSKEIRSRFPFMREREIAVTYEAPASTLRSGNDGGSLRAEAIPHPFVLYVGSAYPHKNLDRLIAGFAELRRRGYSDRSLVLVGAKDYFYERLEREAHENGNAGNVVFFGSATDGELAILYRRAESYVFPSLCEGFGLPPLEAMTHSLPVAASNVSCMPEILGDAALYFDPTQPTSIADALIRLAEEAPLRAALIARGTQQVAKYDWNDCAKKTLAVYHNAHAA